MEAILMLVVVLLIVMVIDLRFAVWAGAVVEGKGDGNQAHEFRPPETFIQAGREPVKKLWGNCGVR